MTKRRRQFGPGFEQDKDDVRALIQEHGGIPAFEDVQLGDSLVQAGPGRFVNITMVWLAPELEEGQAVSSRPYENVDYRKLGCGLRFEVCDEDHKPLYHFSVDHEALIVGLTVAYPQNRLG